MSSCRHVVAQGSMSSCRRDWEPSAKATTIMFFFLRCPLSPRFLFFSPFLVFPPRHDLERPEFPKKPAGGNFLSSREVEGRIQSVLMFPNGVRCEGRCGRSPRAGRRAKQAQKGKNREQGKHGKQGEQRSRESRERRESREAGKQGNQEKQGKQGKQRSNEKA